MNLAWIKMPIYKKKIEIFQNAPDKINKAFFDDLSNSWLHFMRKNTPLGFLFDKNTYKEDLTGEKIRLLHVTPSIEKLKRSGRINPSGGGLGSVIYCCPLHKDFKPHNLFDLYSNFQLPKKISREKIGAICIEIESKFNVDQISSWGVDYTLFGKIHCYVWNDLRSRSKDKRYFLKIEKDVLDRINRNIGYLNLLISYKMDNVNLNNFKQIYNKIFRYFPELRFILYEVLAEYVLLHQTDKLSIEHANKGEFLNKNHKKLIWDLCPTMLKKFNMKNFFIPLDKLIFYLNKKEIILDFNEDQLYTWFKWRISYYFLKIGNGIIDNQDSFDSIIKEHPYFIGQILYRAFYDKHLFEILRSKYLYDEWEKNRIIIPIYPIIAKGEVGINPNLDKLKVKYSIYEVDVINEKIKIGRNINLKISPNMINRKEAVVR